jgi:GntR family transcriptional regulator, transcriptional repressor for pyruvate dehydrogenase complex
MGGSGRGDHLYERLASLIEEGEFTAGSRLPAEAELAERFSVSRAMIREALSRLRENGTIVSRKGAGSFVQRLPGDAPERGCLGFAAISSLTQIRQCYQFRVAVEGEAAFWAAQNRSPEGLERLRGALDRMEDAIARRVVGMDADRDFHVAVARASGNEFFETTMLALRPALAFLINLSRSLSLTRPVSHMRRAQAEHIAIFSAIEAGDREAAREAMRKHIADTCTRMFDGPGSEERRAAP